MSEDWTQWESLVINGVFPLRRFLGKSDHSVVFLTEYKSRQLADAAIKLLPADAKLAEAQLALWRAAAALSHSHLIHLFESGPCRIGGQDFIFVVMEFAAETLAQILPQRALTPGEVREMLLPTLDALAFLHRKNLVQGQLKPPNFLVVNDQLKLASDNIRPAGRPAVRPAKPSLYDPPEAKDGSITAAGDIWGLGVVIVEALTQSQPGWPEPGSETVSLPANLPASYLDIVRRCLSRNRASRPTIGDLEAQIKAAQLATVALPPAPAAFEASAPLPTSRHPGRWISVGVAGGVLLVAAIWLGLRSLHNPSRSRQPAASIAPAAPASLPPAVPPAPVSPSPKPSLSAPAAVLHQEIPVVPRSALASIHGHIRVAVRVTVNRSGEVVSAILEDRGSSRYFARLAAESARRWKFAPAEDPSRVWLLRFEFTRGGAMARASRS